MTGAAWSRLTAVAVLLGLALVAGTGAAAAHSYPVNSDPADSDSLTSGPPRVSITFNEALQTSFDSLSVVGPDGNRWSAGNADVRGAVVSIALNPLGPAGRYTIAYRVVSADSHPVAGTRSFTLDHPRHRNPRSESRFRGQHRRHRRLGGWGVGVAVRARRRGDLRRRPGRRPARSSPRTSMNPVEQGSDHPVQSVVAGCSTGVRGPCSLRWPPRAAGAVAMTPTWSWVRPAKAINSPR